MFLPSLTQWQAPKVGTYMPNRKWLLKGSNQPHGTHINNLNLYSGEYKLVAYRQNFASVQFTSVAQSCLTLCKPMNHSMSGLPVHHQLPESTQTHVLCVGDAIQPSHPLSSPSPPAVNLSQHQGLFQLVSSSHQVAKVLEFQLQHQSFQ